MNKNKLIKKLSSELWEKSSWRFGAARVLEAKNIFDDIAEDTVELLIEHDLLKDNKTYQLECHGYGDWRCPKCGKHFGGYVEDNYCSNCGTKFERTL